MFPRMRHFLGCVLVLACAHRSPAEAPAAGATAAASSMPSNRSPASTSTPEQASAAQQPSAPAPAAGAAPAGAPAGSPTQPAARGPMTAAEAAEAASREAHGGGDGVTKPADDTSPCSTDADCTMTRHPPGNCCASLCTPRAVTRTQAEALQQRDQSCRCAMPLCRPPLHEKVAACVQNRCVEKDAGPSY